MTKREYGKQHEKSNSSCTKDAHNSILHNSQKVETNVHQWMDEYNVAYSYKRILFGH